MSLPEAILTQIKCCLSNDGHIIIDPVLLRCKGNACKECVSDSKEEVITCYSCSGKHEKINLLNSTENTLAETLVKTFIDDLFEYTEKRIKKITETLKGEILYDLS
jgi:hypothetical protein